MKKQIAIRSMWIFGLTWFGQVVSSLGSGLTGFALGVRVLQRTGSVTSYALIAFFTVLPGVVIAPLAGALVDRWDRRWVMILSNAGSSLSILSLALLFFFGQLQIWHIYLAMGVNAAFSAFLWPAFSASITLLVHKQQFGRANGMVQLGQAAAQILAPVLAGVLIAIIDITGLLLIDFATFLFAIITLLLVVFPQPEISAEGAAAKGSLLREAGYGWSYVTARPGLWRLLLFFAATNFSVGMIQILITPLVLGFASPVVLGTVMSVAGLGMLVGSLAISVWGGPPRRIYGVLGFTLLQGLLLFLGGLRPNALLIATAAFVFLFCTPIINGCSETIWQSKVAPDIQGRVFAIRTMIAWSSIPLAYLVAGPLADKVFEPLMAKEGLLAPSVGRLIGVGPGRGIGLLFTLLGFLILVAVAAGYRSQCLWRVEDELPDALADQTSLQEKKLVSPGHEPEQVPMI